MSNFEFLREKPLFCDFAEACIDAENSMTVSYATSAMQTRRALELAVKWVYANDSALPVPYQDNLQALIRSLIHILRCLRTKTFSNRVTSFESNEKQAI